MEGFDPPHNPSGSFTKPKISRPIISPPPLLLQSPKTGNARVSFVDSPSHSPVPRNATSPQPPPSPKREFRDDHALLQKANSLIGFFLTQDLIPIISSPAASNPNFPLTHSNSSPSLNILGPLTFAPPMPISTPTNDPATLPSFFDSSVFSAQVSSSFPESSTPSTDIFMDGLSPNTRRSRSASDVFESLEHALQDLQREEQELSSASMTPRQPHSPHSRSNPRHRRSEKRGLTFSTSPLQMLHPNFTELSASAAASPHSSRKLHLKSPRVVRPSSGMVCSSSSSSSSSPYPRSLSPTIGDSNHGRSRSKSRSKRRKSYARKMSPLFAAIRNNDVPLSIELIATLPEDALRSYKTQHGTSCLHLAAERNMASIADALLQRHARVNSRNYAGQTPLHLAVRANAIDCVRVLVGAGADLNRQDRLLRNTALHDAIQAGNFGIFQLLIDAGANPEIRNAFHQSGLPFLNVTLQKAFSNRSETFDDFSIKPRPRRSDPEPASHRQLILGQLGSSMLESNQFPNFGFRTLPTPTNSQPPPRAGSGVLMSRTQHGSVRLLISDIPTGKDTFRRPPALVESSPQAEHLDPMEMASTAPKPINFAASVPQEPTGFRAPEFISSALTMSPSSPALLRSSSSHNLKLNTTSSVSSITSIISDDDSRDDTYS